MDDQNSDATQTEHTHMARQHKDVASRIASSGNTNGHQQTLLVWLDMEMSGLDITRNVILEVAAVVTTPDLVELKRFSSVVYWPHVTMMSNMSDWCKRTFNHNGLFEDQKRIAFADPQTVANHRVDAVENRLLQVLDSLGADQPWTHVHLCGFSVYKDLQFLQMYMPTVASRFSHRIIDLTSVGLVLKHWGSTHLNVRKRTGAYNHRALDDAVVALDFARQLRQVFGQAVLTSA